MKLKTLLLSIIFISTTIYADLDDAVKLAEQGKVREGKLELVRIVNNAEAGDAKSQFEFGTMWATEGFWLWKDDERALEWWRKSAEQGYAPAQIMMGSVYLGGFKEEKDMAKADKWFQKAIASDKKYINAVDALKKLNALAVSNRLLSKQ